MKENRQKHPLPAYFSACLPGFGQLIKGSFLSFFYHLLIYFALFIGFVTVTVLGDKELVLWPILGTIVFYIWSIYDAYNN